MAVTQVSDKQLRDNVKRTRADAARIVHAAHQAARDAETTASAFCDAVSQVVERRLGIDLEDPRRFDDPEYSAALDVFQAVVHAHEAIERAAKLLEPKQP